MTRRWVSNSEIGTFRRCRRKWWLGYFRRLTPVSDVQSLGLNRMVGVDAHGALQRYYAGDGDPLQYVREAAQRRRETLEAQADEDSPVNDQDLKLIAKAEELTLAMIEGYLEWVAEEGVDQGLTVRSTESEIAINLYDVAPRSPVARAGIGLVGKLDARFHRDWDGAIFFMDHKTVGNLSELPKWAHLDTQLLHYHLLEYLEFLRRGADAEEIEATRTDGGVLNMLRKVKRTASANPPFYGRHEVRHNLEELRNHWRHVLGEVTRIMEAESALRAGVPHHEVCPPTPKRDCTWDCDFFALCHLLDDGSDAEGMIAELYKEHDPLERYTSLEKG